MSLLPQRKKSPEEIAQLRESLGIPAFPAAEEPAASADPAAQVEELPAAPAGPKPVRSLKRSESILPVAEIPPLAQPAVPVLSVQPVRSLRKSEQVPVTRLAAPPADSILPSQRHNDDEILAIRRRDAFATLPPPVVNPKLVPAHPALITLGYLAVVAGAVTASLEPPATVTPADLSWVRLFGHAFAFDPRPLAIPVGCVAAALLVAVPLFSSNRRSSR